MYNILHYNKENVHFIYIKTDELDVTLSNLGASIYEIKYNNELMTLTTKNILDFKRPDMFFGKTIPYLGFNYPKFRMETIFLTN